MPTCAFARQRDTCAVNPINISACSAANNSVVVGNGIATACGASCGNGGSSPMGSPAIGNHVPRSSDTRPFNGGKVSSRQPMRRSPICGSSGFSALPRPSPSGWKVAARLPGNAEKFGRNKRH